MARRVDYLGREFLALVLDDFAEGVLNGRVIALDEVSIDKLHRQGRLS